MSTTDELTTSVKSYLGMANTSASASGNPSNAAILRALNVAQDLLSGHLSVTYKRRFLTTANLTYTASTEAVALPSGCQNQPILKVLAQPTTSTLRQFPLRPLVVDEFDRMALIGTPQAYAVAGTNIMLRPYPPVSYALVIWYDAAASALVAGGAGPSWLAPKFHDLVALDAAIRLRVTLGDPVDTLKAQRSDDFESLNRYYFALQEDNHAHEVAGPEDY